MSPSIEDILGQALTQLSRGKSRSEVISQWPEHAAELSSLLDTVSLLQDLPKKTVPQPAMQRKYILMPVKRSWLHWARISRIAAVSISVLMLTAIGGTAAYTAYTSKPGETAFELKKAAEHLQVQLTFNREQKIQLQVEIAQKRLDDAQAALQDINTDQVKQTAALAELATETEKTIDALNQATQNNSKPLVSNKDNPLIASLGAITAKQQTLLKNLNAAKSETIDKAILAATEQNANKVAAIKDYLTAANSDQTLAILQSNPNAFTVIGPITQLTYNTLTVKGQTFTFTRETITKSATGTIISIRDLQLKQQVQIFGDKTDDNLIARQIMEIDSSGQVKGAETGSPATASSSNPGEKRLPTSTPPSASPGSMPDPNAAIGTFIPEDPAPQTNFNN